MRHETGQPGGLRLRRRRRPFPLFRLAAFSFGLALFAVLSFWPDAPPPSTTRDAAPKIDMPSSLSAAPAPAPYDARFAAGLTARPLAASAPLSAAFVTAYAPARQTVPATEPPPEDVPALPLPPIAERPRILEVAPLPAPRPLDLIAPKTADTPRLAAPATPRRNRVAAVKPAEPEDNRNFFQKLFGVQPAQPGTVLAYAAPQDSLVDEGRGRRLSPLSVPALTTAARTAIYDIEAKTVYLPNGERLEAHSGFGEMMDDVRFAHVRMKGVTPPHVYDLVEREALFHGHRAIRLHPVGGSRAIHGRAGLLAHPYLLGPRGDSNGCVSVKDYDRFLQAYLRGEIKRLVVVARQG